MALRAVICREPDGRSTGFIVEVSLYSCAKSHSKQCTKAPARSEGRTHPRDTISPPYTSCIHLDFQQAEGRT